MTQITDASRETMVGTLKARQEEVRKLDKIILKRDYNCRLKTDKTIFSFPTPPPMIIHKICFYLTIFLISQFIRYLLFAAQRHILPSLQN